MAETLTATLELERATKNKHRYKETADSEAGGAIETLYLSKVAAGRVLGDGKPPEKIKVTVETT